MEPPRKKSPLAQIGTYLSLGFFLPSAIAAGYLIGLALDGVFETTFLRIVFLLVGIVAGFVELIRVASRGSW